MTEQINQEPVQIRERREMNRKTANDALSLLAQAAKNAIGENAKDDIERAAEKIRRLMRNL